jgi:hypothetical protein
MTAAYVCYVFQFTQEKISDSKNANSTVHYVTRPEHSEKHAKAAGPHQTPIRAYGFVVSGFQPGYTTNMV